MIKNFIRKIYISKSISYMINLLGAPWRGKGAILVYHRVLPDDQIKADLDFGLTVSCHNFEKQIKKLKSKYKVCSMDEFVDNLKKNKNEFMLAITFDDGYKDNLIHALPILEKFEIPASIYITTKFLNENIVMWWYELSEVIRDNSTLRFEFEKKNFYFSIKNHKQKLIAFKNLKNIFLNLKIDKQNELLEKITNTEKRKNYSEICLNSKEVKILDKHPLITIGSHSHNHLNFRILSNDEIQHEVTKSSEILENLLNHEIKHFCYPYGGKNQASHREFDIIENLNFDSAVTGRTYPIKNYNLFSLPRIYVGKNTCEEMLINHLSGFYNLAKKFF